MSDSTSTATAADGGGVGPASSQGALSVDLRDDRVEKLYQQPYLSEADMPAKDPMRVFDMWFTAMKQTTPMFEEQNGMVLATASADGRPSARRLLLKAYDTEGFTFYTNYESRKGKELSENSFAALEFYWPRFHNRAVRVEGRVTRLPASDADLYWQRRPLQSRISAYVSAQSSVIPSRDHLTDLVRQTEAEFGTSSADACVPRPASWGGYRLVPDRVEFWQGRSDRLHDRIRFRREAGATPPDGVLVKQGDDGWLYERLSP